jgi:catechol 2,3-dioxygenase-like lactoylglutathione lyase family enzyme
MRIQGFDHVGIRVSDAGRALQFYAKLGFSPDPEFSDDRVAEIVAHDGTRINLVFNGVERDDAHNVLLDEPTKWPGYTHAAFIVDSLQGLLDWAAEENVRITEGPSTGAAALPASCAIRTAMSSNSTSCARAIAAD